MPQARHTIVLARASSRAAPTSPHPRPLHSHSPSLCRLTYPAQSRCIPPPCDGFKNDAYTCIIPKRTILPDTHLPACADAAPFSLVAAVSDRRAREAQLTCPTTSRSLPVHVVTTRAGCLATRLPILAEPAPEWPPSNNLFMKARLIMIWIVRRPGRARHHSSLRTPLPCFQ